MESEQRSSVGRWVCPMITSLEHWVLEENAPTEYLYSSSDGAWVSQWQANRYLRPTRQKNPHIIYFVTDYLAKDLFNLGERAYLYFYYFALIMIMNKRLTLMLTANFTSQYLRLHSSLGCVQPCTVLLPLPRINCRQATSVTGPEVDASLSRLLSFLYR